MNFQSRFNVKIHVQVLFTIASQFYVHLNVELYVHALIHLYGEEKQVCQTFFIIHLVHDIGGDYTSQSRSEFDWYNPHLYSYCGIYTPIRND